MATGNFSPSKHLSSIYAVLMSEEQQKGVCDTCGEEIPAWEYEPSMEGEPCECCEGGTIEEQDYIYTPEYDEILDFCGNFPDNMEGFAKDIRADLPVDVSKPRKETYHHTGYGDSHRVLAYLDYTVYYGNLPIQIEASVILKAGYYDGATIDIVPTISIAENDPWDFETWGEDGSWTTFKKLLEEDVERWYDNAGLAKIHAPKVRDKAEQAMADFLEYCDKVFERMSRPLYVAAAFSNGETWYKEKNTETAS